VRHDLTGFSLLEFSLGSKWLYLLREGYPRHRASAVMFNQVSHNLGLRVHSAAVLAQLPGFYDQNLVHWQVNH